MLDAKIRGLCGILAIAIGLVGDAAYIWTTLRGATRPHVFSWLLWLLIGAIVLPGQLMSGAGAGALLTAYNVAFCALITVLAMWHGETTYTRGDRLMLLGALAGIPVWLLTHDPLWSICLETMISLIAGVPTLLKSYRLPYSENALTYAGGSLAFLADCAAMKEYDFTTLIFPVNGVIFNGGIAVMLLLRRLAKSGDA